MHEKAKYYISKLDLTPHPEGGYFKEIYRAGEIYEADFLPERYNSNRAFSTSIYFLLESNQVSTFHKLKSDEIWHFYDGSPVTIFCIEKKGNFRQIKLGQNLEAGEVLQTVIKRDTWFGAKVNGKNSFTFVGCTVSPGFDFDDFELGERENLIRQFPQHKNIIEELTK